MSVLNLERYPNSDSVTDQHDWPRPCDCGNRTAATFNPVVRDERLRCHAVDWHWHQYLNMLYLECTDVRLSNIHGQTDVYGHKQIYPFVPVPLISTWALSCCVESPAVKSDYIKFLLKNTDCRSHDIASTSRHQKPLSSARFTEEKKDSKSPDLNCLSALVLLWVTRLEHTWRWLLIKIFLRLRRGLLLRILSSVVINEIAPVLDSMIWSTSKIFNFCSK